MDNRLHTGRYHVSFLIYVDIREGFRLSTTVARYSRLHSVVRSLAEQTSQESTLRDLLILRKEIWPTDFEIWSLFHAAESNLG